MILSKKIKTWLEKKKLYLRFRYYKSVLFSWLLLRPSVRKELTKQKELYLPLLHLLSCPSKVIFDIGANEGFLTNIFANAGYTVVAVEPVKRNIAILKTRFSKNANVIVIEAAVSNKQGKIDFFEPVYSYAFGTASNKWKESEGKSNPGVIYSKRPVTVSALTIDKLVEEYGRPVFIKIDVEGYEEHALNGLSQIVPLISFEAILPEFLKETENCITRLAKLSGNAVFTFAIDNQLQHEDFFPSGKMLDRLHQLPAQTIEIFCKM